MIKGHKNLKLHNFEIFKLIQNFCDIFEWKEVKDEA